MKILPTFAFKSISIMKRFSLIIAALVFSASLMAQPFPTTFKSVQITGSYKAVVKQLEAEGFKAAYEGKKELNGMHEGEKTLVKIGINKDIDQVCSLTVNRSVIERDSAEDISAKFNAIYEKFAKDPKYTSDRANRKADGGASFDPNISIGIVFQAKFYQDGDPNRLVELNIRRYQAKYHYKEIKYINCYNLGVK